MSSTDSTQKISRYAILSRLGEGGIGVVYKAFDPNLNKIVAIKVLNTGTLRADQHVRFQNEARALAELKHRAIPEIYNFSISEAGAPYMVMEFIEGKSLLQLLSEQRQLSVDNALAITKQVANALQSAHSMGIFHRDVTPANIIIDVEGEIKLVDFGLVKFEKSLDQYQTKTGKVIGSPAYMSPEQIRTLAIDGRTDIYSLGCVLFEMLSGKTPYTADSAIEMVSSHLNDEIPRLPDDISTDQISLSKLQTIINRCLAKEADNRFQKMQELENALESLVGTENRPLNLDTTSNTKANLPIIPIALLVLVVSSALVFQVFTQIQGTPWPQLPSVTKTKKHYPLSQLESIEPSLLDKRPQPWVISSGRKAATAIKEELTDDDFKWLRNHPESKNIHFIVADYANLTGSGLRHLNGMQVKKLKIVSPHLKSENLKYLQQFSEITDLSIGGTALGLDAYRQLAKLRTLSLLKLMEMDVPKKALTILGTLPKLTTLNMVSDHGKNLYHADFKELSGLHQLESLGIRGFDFTNNDLIYVSKLKKLINLDLKNIPIDDSNIDLLQTLPELQIVNLSNTNITEKGLESVSKIKKLNILIIINCKNLSDARVMAFKHSHPKVTVQSKISESYDMEELAGEDIKGKSKF